MNSHNTMIAHVKILQKVIEDLELVHHTKDYGHRVTENVHMAVVHCNKTLDVLHQFIGESLVKRGKSEE